MKPWDSRAARDNLAFLVKDFQRLKRQMKEQFDVGQEIIAIERIESETNALWGMWNSSSASGSRLSVSPEVWLSHFSTLYHSPHPICLPRSLTGPPDAFLDRAFSTTDVLRAVSRSANGKASGPDRLTNECLKDALGVLLVPLTNLFNFCVSHGCCTPQWFHSYLLTLYKGKGSKSDPNSARGIALQPLIPREQHGFRFGKSTMSAIADLSAWVKDSLSKPKCPLYTI